MMCLPFQYFIIPKAWSVLTMSYELMAISYASDEREKNHENYLTIMFIQTRRRRSN